MNRIEEFRRAIARAEAQERTQQRLVYLAAAALPFLLLILTAATMRG